MKLVLTFTIIALANLTFSQATFPDFLQGTWKMENKEIYEHWDKLDNKELKGISYRINDGQLFVFEYLDIIQKNNEIIYTAIVLDQNQKEGVEFKMTQTDSTFIFENAYHDFPKKIVYQKLSDTRIFVQVLDEKQKGYGYGMTKQCVVTTEQDTTISNPDYDMALAEKLGADDYGMKKYFLVILKTGTNTTAEKQLITESFRGHLDNINKLVKEGKLVVAGPLGKNENSYRGIFILNNINTIEEAQDLLQTDPAIKNSFLDYEIFNWYGSAALPEYLPVSDKIWKSNP